MTSVNIFRVVPHVRRWMLLTRLFALPFYFICFNVHGTYRHRYFWPIDEDFGLRYIIVIIDTFTRYVSPTTRMTFQLWQRPTLYSATLVVSPLPYRLSQIIGQLVNEMLTQIYEITVIKHTGTLSSDDYHGKPVSDSQTKPKCTIRNLVTGKEYMVDVTHLQPFCFDPAYVTPLNIAVKDTYKFVMERII